MHTYLVCIGVMLSVYIIILDDLDVSWNNISHQAAPDELSRHSIVGGLVGFFPSNPRTQDAGPAISLYSFRTSSLIRKLALFSTFLI